LGNENATSAFRSGHEESGMTAFVERIVQKFTEAAPIENAVSTIVAGVLENTATKLSRGEIPDGEALEAGEASPSEHAA